jgi:hypothetical protein
LSLAEVLEKQKLTFRFPYRNESIRRAVF